MPQIISSIKNLRLNTVKIANKVELQAVGVVISGDWTQPMLIPHEYFRPPQDGVYDFTFYATPPIRPASAALTRIDVLHQLSPLPSGMLGVRVRARTNSMEFYLKPQTFCDYVSGNSFVTAQRFEGGLGPVGSDTQSYWSINFTTDGKYTHLFSDVVVQGSYFCDKTGFQLINSSGTPVPDVSVHIQNQGVNIPVSTVTDRWYFLKTPTAAP